MRSDLIASMTASILQSSGSKDALTNVFAETYARHTHFLAHMGNCGLGRRDF
jgi:hypothetical protein